MKAIHLHLRKIKSLKIILFLSFLIPVKVAGQWLTTENAERKITVFKPAIEKYESNTIDFRAAIAVTERNEEIPTFGSIWGFARLKDGASRETVNMWGVIIEDIRFPNGITDEQLNDLSGQIEDAINARQPELLINDILTDRQNAETEKVLSAKINNNPPHIYYSSETALLVNIDGEPILNKTDTQGVDMVVNTPFLILKYQTYYYLGNGTVWYKSSNPADNFYPEMNIPNAVIIAANALKTSDEEGMFEVTDGFYPKVIVSTEPAELIQTDGSPAFSAIQGTSLLFVNNTEDHLLFDINRQMFYALLSGRWYAADKLDGAWMYVSPDKLPSDFTNIPEGTEKDAVLANVAGTRASAEAVRNAMVPQTAIVDRKTATSEVVYDGNPNFESIQGTDLRMAVNSSNTVIVERNNYFLVDNGVWFTSNSPNGPWYVSDYRPAQVVLIPPASPAYNVKYVEIYHSTPNVVYVGYTSGYLSGYVVNRTIVYGTGYRYKPWRGRYYYPRPCTWGYGMTYNPWYGWSLNMSYGVGGHGWFAYGHPHYYYPAGYYHRHCGWWGPSVYRPPYCVPYSHYYGHRPAYHRPVYYGHHHIVNKPPVAPPRPANIYGSRTRPGVSSTRPAQPSTRPSSRENYDYSNRARPETTPSVSGRQSTTTRPNTGSSTRQDTRENAIRQGTTTQPAARPNTRTESATPANSRTNSNTQQNVRQESATPTNSRTNSNTQQNTRQESTTPANSRTNSNTQQNVRQESATPTNSRTNSNTQQNTRQESTTPANSRSNSNTQQNTRQGSTTQPTAQSNARQGNTSSANNQRSATAQQSSSRNNSSSSNQASSVQSSRQSTQSSSSSSSRTEANQQSASRSNRASR